MLRTIVDAARSAGSVLLSPPRCSACDELLDARGAAFCPPCAETVEHAPGFDASFVYGGAISAAIVRLKYAGRPDLGSRLGALMASSRSAARLVGRVDIVIPVPLHTRRLAERGYNHAALLAAPLARALGVAYGPRGLDRVRDTPRQAALDRSRRLVNVARAFACREPSAVDGARVLLVDDVRTTGATLAACTSTLAMAGAREVVAFVLATREHA